MNPLMPSTPTCPICRKAVLPRDRNPVFPFCSARCRAVDLGKWLGEEYRVPAGSHDEQEDELPPVPGDGHAEDEA